jgi:hypothetical protein
MEKLYARNPATAVNIEAHLKQFVEEGLRHFSHEDSSSAIMPARAMVIAGLTPGLYGRMFSNWTESGFARRFMKVQFTMENEHAILDAIHKWQKITLPIPTVWENKILLPYNLTEKDSRLIMEIIKEQPDSTPTALLKRVAVVLKSRFPNEWSKILLNFAPALSRNGALLRI